MASARVAVHVWPARAVAAREKALHSRARGAAACAVRRAAFACAFACAFTSAFTSRRRHAKCSARAEGLHQPAADGECVVVQVALGVQVAAGE